VAPGAPTPEEAAAIVAAVERFLRDHAASSATAPDPDEDPWRRAALLDGVRRDPTPFVPHPWINT
jgi:hypothetical protein